MSKSSIKKLGQGSFGIVYRPYPVDCKESQGLPPPRQNYIGKMSDPESMESANMKRIQTRRALIDPKEQYTSPLYAICHKSTSKDPTHPYWKTKKGKIRVYLQICRVFVYHLYLNDIRKPCLQHIYKSFDRLLNGMRRMIHHKIVHGDTYNVQINRSYLIDYDYLMPFSELISGFRSSMKHTVYVFWPPEINFGLLRFVHP